MVNRHADSSARLPIVRLLKETWSQWYQSNAFQVGAALAFYAIFSVAPVIVLAFTAASVVLGPDVAQGRMTNEIESISGHTVAVAVQATAQHTYRSGSSVPATILGIIFFGFGATGFFSQLQTALNAIWQVDSQAGQRRRRILRDRLGSFLALLGTSTLLLAALLMTPHGALSPAEKALAQRPSGATQARECHCQLFTNSADTPRQESKRITRIEAREATAEVETMTGAGVQVLSTGTMVHVFLVAPHVPANSWSGNGAGDPC